MKTYKVLVSDNEIIEIDDLSDPHEVYQFLLKHRLDKVEVKEWLSTLDYEDNGFVGYTRFKYPESESFLITSSY